MRNTQAPQPPGPRGLLRVHPRVALLGTLALALVALAVVSVGAPAEAHPAAPSGDTDRVRLEVVGGAGRLEFDAMAPGLGATREVVLAADGDGPMAVRLGVTGMVSRDHGCLRPERRAGDVTCRGAGELLPWLTVRVDRVGADSQVAGLPLYAGSLAGLAARPRGFGLDRAVSPGSPERLRITVVPDVAMGNDTMTDSVNFTLWWSARGQVGQLGSGVTTQDPGPSAAPPVGDPDARSVAWLPSWIPGAGSFEEPSAVALSGQSGNGVHVEDGIRSQPWILLVAALFVFGAAWVARRVLPDQR